MPIQDLELSVRASNCLESARIATVGELVQLTESDLLKVRSFGKTSLREVKRKLGDLGLDLGMRLEQQNPENPGGAAVASPSVVPEAPESDGVGIDVLESKP